MAALLTSLSLNDLLSQSKLKPWWESVRSAAILLMGSATILLQLTPDYGRLSCVPSNKTSMPDYGVAEAKFVEYSCLSETNGALSYMYWTSVVGTALTFAFSNVWSYIPDYGKSISSFVQTCELYKPIAPFVSEILENDENFLMNNWVKNHYKKEISNTLKNIRTLYRALAKGPKSTSKRVPAANGSPLLPASSSSNIVKLRPGTSDFFVKVYFFKNMFLSIVSSATLVLTIVHIVKLESLPEEITCEKDGFAQSYTCLLLSRNTHRLVYICFLLSSFTIAVESIFLCCYYRLSENFYDIDLFLSFAKLSSEMDSLNGLPRFVGEFNKRKQLENVLQKCAIHGFDARDLLFFKFCVRELGMKKNECLKLVKMRSPETKDDSRFRSEILRL